MRASQDHRFLKFLSSLCVANERPIPSNQSIISFNRTKCIVLSIDRLLKELVLDHGKVSCIDLITTLSCCLVEYFH